jgi:hypothetical protein
MNSHLFLKKPGKSNFNDKFEHQFNELEKRLIIVDEEFMKNTHNKHVPKEILKLKKKH